MRWTKYKPDFSIRFFVYLFVCAFLVGAICMNQLWKYELFRDYISVYMVLEGYQKSYTDIKSYVLFMIREKLLMIGGCLITALAGAGEIFAVIFSLWLGFLGGGLAILFLLQSGMRGFLFVMSGIISQLIFYLPAVILFLLLMGKTFRGIPGGGSISQTEFRNMVILCVVFVVIMLLGIGIECYVNSKTWLEIFF